MNKEIGGEFWECDNGRYNDIFGDFSDKRYLLSGRTALDYIIQDISSDRQVKSAYIPAYCCSTMILPFLKNNIKTEFYNVDFVDGCFVYEIDNKINCDIMLIMQYFGFANKSVPIIIKKLKKETNMIIIEDATHSWVSDRPFSQFSDYVFASFRKWTALPAGAIAAKRRGKFKINTATLENHEYIRIRNEAAELKNCYINRRIGEKNEFLMLFQDAELMLEQDYQDYTIGSDLMNAIEHIDIKKLKTKRRRNAKVLIDGMKKFIEINTVALSKNDAPLFVPIVIQNNDRNKLKDYLIKNKIYCPVHWPLSNYHNKKICNIYQNILSLVCDQRYDKADMYAILNCIESYYQR